jgi:hypothetical protein
MYFEKLPEQEKQVRKEYERGPLTAVLAQVRGGRGDAHIYTKSVVPRRLVPKRQLTSDGVTDVAERPAVLGLHRTYG